ncbi:staphylococcal secretory antigen ssaA2 [Bactrocera oleae]|uniref:staphylococcal secretory antigen ssaA2 n=1 Tax=Bactrocera oleae TaxID=104688 RepID=UPI00387E4D59
MSALLSYLLCASVVTLSLAAPQYVDPYATSYPQFAKLSGTPYTGYPYGYNPYNSGNTYNPYNNYNSYNPYNRNTGTNTYWNGFAWVNSFRSAS